METTDDTIWEDLGSVRELLWSRFFSIFDGSSLVVAGSWALPALFVPVDDCAVFWRCVGIGTTDAAISDSGKSSI